MVDIFQNLFIHIFSHFTHSHLFTNQLYNHIFNHAFEDMFTLVQAPYKGYKNDCKRENSWPHGTQSRRKYKFQSDKFCTEAHGTGEHALQVQA